jgi:HD-GYP domain-containing protein (c-di-GMP phosphodiesterase class II)
MRLLRRAERDLDEQLDQWAGIDRRIEPALKPVELESPGRLGWPSTGRLRAYRQDRARRIAVMHRAILSGETLTPSEPMLIVRELLDLYVGYPDRFARLATIGAAGGEHPIAEHALSVCALSIAIAARLGWSVFDIQRAGLGGLFADLGMTLEPVDLRGPLDEIAAARLRRHPLASAVMLRSLEEAPEPVILAVAQHHERLDGAGYPLGARGEEIHDIARVLAVADSFAAAIAPRRHRSPNRPHAALVDVCRQAVGGELDRQVALALVRVVGVFPVGAAVALDTGDAGVVISSPADTPARPRLRLLTRAANAEFATEIDLAQTDNVRITAELAPAEAADARGARLSAA